MTTATANLAALVAVLVAVGCTQPAPEQAPRTAGAPVTTPAATATTPSPACPDPCRAPPKTIGAFPVRQAPEASGLVASRRHDDILYVVDDGPGTTSVLAISANDGEVAGRVAVAGLEGTDTEALAAGPCSPQPGTCVYVGDIGDNARARDHVSVHRFAEPSRLEGSGTVEADRIDLRYPDAPHDAEALLVDRSGRIGIVTKDAGDGDGRTGAARLYTVDGFADATLADRGAVPVPMPALPLAAAAVGNVVTGGDWAPGRVVLRTYDAVVEYRAPRGRGGLVRFSDWPVTEVVTGAEQQGEAVAYGADGCSLYTVGEGSGEVTAALCR